MASGLGSIGLPSASPIPSQASTARRASALAKATARSSSDASSDTASTAASLPGVTKLEIANNEFGLKYRILRQEPKGKFLLFKDGPEPEMTDNWLLDLQLASAVFKADQAAIWLAELGLPLQFENVVRGHIEFFRAKARVEALKRLMPTSSSDTQTQMRIRMLAVCAGAEGGLDTVIEALLGELAVGRDDALRLIERSGLTDFLWKQVGQAYGYKPDEPDFEDFAIALFQSAYARVLGEDGALNAEALLVFRRWKNNRHWAEAFETLSARYQDLLKIPADLQKRDFRTLVGVDHFEEIDRQIIREIVRAMSAQSVSAPEVLNWVSEHCRAGDLLAEDELRAAGRDEPQEGRGEMAVIVLSLALPGLAEWLASARCPAARARRAWASAPGPPCRRNHGRSLAMC